MTQRKYRAKRMLSDNCCLVEAKSQTFSDEAAGTSYVQAKSVLTAHFTPKNNVPYNRHMFHRESQLAGETVGNTSRGYAN